MSNDLDALPEEPKRSEITGMNALITTVDYLEKLRAHCRRNIEARKEAVETATYYERWLSGGVYFTTKEYKQHTEENREALESAEARAWEMEELVRRMLRMIGMAVGPTAVMKSENNPIREWVIDANKALQPEGDGNGQG